MAAIYSNFFSGNISDSPLTFSATTLNMANLASLPAVASPDYAWLTLDPTGANGNPEIVKVTAHTTGSTTATIARGQQGTTARQHSFGTKVVMSITQTDIFNMTNVIEDVAANRPTASAALSGLQYWATDTLTLSLCDGTGWIIMREPNQSYTPTWTNVTLGSGSTVSGTYNRSGGFCDFNIYVILGTGGVLTGSVSVNLPVAALSTTRNWAAVNLLQSGVNNYNGIAEAVIAGTSMPIFNALVSASLIVANSLSATNPWTWKAADQIQVVGRYRMNTPYL